MLAAEERDDLEAAEIVGDKGQYWIAERRIAADTVRRMLRLCLVRECTYGGGAEHYTLNEDGRALAADENYVPAIISALANGPKETP